MQIDVALGDYDLAETASFAQTAEALGFDTLWTSEIQHDPFLPLALAAPATRTLKLGTAVAIAFARSPTVVAHTAWDLAASTGGRFILGLGTQVKAHIERRFGMPWSAPVPRLREYVAAVRAVWAAWQDGTRVNVRGEHYKLTLMTPFFSPQPLSVPPPPIYLAGVGAPLCRLAGEVADGFLVHPYHSPRYLAEVSVPALAEGAARAGRPLTAVSRRVTTFYVPEGARAAERTVRAQIAFYASTPSYQGVLACHGWEATGVELSALAQRGEWPAMTGLISDAMLDAFAVSCKWSELAGVLRARYAGLAEHVQLYHAFKPGEDESGWRALRAGLVSEN